MLEIKSKLKISRGAYKLDVKGQLRLPFEQRQKSRFLSALEGGEEVSIKLPRGEVLRGGDLLVASDGRVIEVIAAPEALVHVDCDSAAALAKAAYHLGSRHVALQIGAGFVRTSADHVLEQMLKRLGFKTHPVTEPFEPEPGAYGGEHAHDDHAEGKIHEYGHGHDHGHGHGHGHDHDDHDDHDDHHGHDHDHDHKHGKEHAKGHDHDHDDHGHGHGHDHDHDHDHGHGKGH